MKFLIILSTCFLFSSLTQAEYPINLKNQEQVFKIAKAKTKTVYYGLGKIEPIKLKVAKRTKTDCKVVDYSTNTIACTITDIHAEHGWTEGLYVEWIVERPGQENSVYWFSKAQVLAH